jgi:hypothetical protein
MESTTRGRKKRLSPGHAAVTAFLVTVALGVSVIAVLMLVGPPVPAVQGSISEAIGAPIAPEAAASAGVVGDALNTVLCGTCPVALAVALVAYAVAKAGRGSR